MSLTYMFNSQIPLHQSILQCDILKQDQEQYLSCRTFGGLLDNINYIWFANGPYFQIVNSKNGKTIASWTFGAVLKDFTTKVVCVEPINKCNSNFPLLAIGLECESDHGMICIFDIVKSKVLRVIQIDNRVTSLCVVDDGSSDTLPLPGPLRGFDGVLAVATRGGDILLVDLCRQVINEDAEVRDEVNPCELMLLTRRNIHKIEHYKEKSMGEGFHLAINLNAVTDAVLPHFALKNPKGDTVLYVNKSEVAVSALHYCPQLGSLLTGYNFGALQLWNIMNMTLVYTSPVFESNTPVSHFAVQEPSDDPRAFCYIWAVYSQGPFHSGFPIAALYSLSFRTKEFHEGYGYLYQDFVSCRVCFEMELSLPDSRHTIKKPKGAHCLSLKPLSSSSVNRRGPSIDSSEDNTVVCSFVWTVWCSKQEMYTYQCLFDLNQWYKEQMPREPLWDDCGSYMVYTNISNLFASRETFSEILDIRIKLATIHQFVGVQRLEEHYYPSSLSFDGCILRLSDVTFFRNRGMQQEFLFKLKSTGPMALVTPHEILRRAVSVGLIPLFTDFPSHVSLSLSEEREILLSIALEYHVIDWLFCCAKEFSNGSYSTAGCTLEFLLKWAWDRTIVLKNHADEYCIPLFDYSGVRLDGNAQKYLNSCEMQLKALHTFYSYIVDNFITFLPNTDIVLLERENLHMVSTYFEVLQWLLNVNLLPEVSSVQSDHGSQVSVPYPVEILVDYYNKRRTTLQQLNKQHFSSSDSLLFIDNLIDIKCGGVHLQRQWQQDGGNGLYPPSSLQALLRTYLIENIDISHKHSLVVYVFLDLAMVLSQEKYMPTITQLIKFPAVFKLSQSTIKITQAFWQLDHEDFSTAMEHLMDPLVSLEDLKIWHHKIVLKSLFSQKQYSFALLYLQVRQPPVIDDEDIFLGISLYVTNDMLDEALYFQKQYQNDDNEEILLEHLFKECDCHNKLKLLMGRSLSSSEEKIFFKYLADVKHPKMDDIKVFYNIQRSRYMEAFNYNDRLPATHGAQGLHGQANMVFRDFIVNSYKKLLPSVSQNLLNVCRQNAANPWKQFNKPQPMSVFVHNTGEQIKYKSTLINASLIKTKEIWMNPILNKSASEKSSENTPFLRTPTIIKKAQKCLTPLTYSKELTVNEDDTSIVKRLRLSSRQSISRENIDSTLISCATHSVKLDTPIIKRKTPKRQSPSAIDKFVCTPQSILKVRSLVQKVDSPVIKIAGRGESTTPENLDDVIDDINQKTYNDSTTSKPKRSYNLTPRRRVSELPAVRFNDSQASTVTGESSIVDPVSLNTTKTEDTTKSSKTDSKLFESSSHEDTFYSPDSSLNIDSFEIQNDSALDKLEEEFRKIEEDSNNKSEVILAENVTEETETSSLSVSADAQSNAPALVELPKPRRSYRSSDITPVRSSPRRKVSISSIEKTSPSVSTIPSIKKRRSLSQQVLTNNALTKMRGLSTPKKVIEEKLFSKTDTITTEIKQHDEIKKTESCETIEIKDVSTSETCTPDSGKLFSHIHSERKSMSNLKTLESSGESFQWDVSSDYEFSAPEDPDFSYPFFSDNEKSAELSKRQADADKDLTEVSIHHQEEIDTHVEHDDEGGEKDDVQNKEDEKESQDVVAEEVKCDQEVEYSSNTKSDPVMNIVESSTDSLNNAVLVESTENCDEMDKIEYYTEEPIELNNLNSADYFENEEGDADFNVAFAEEVPKVDPTVDSKSDVIEISDSSREENSNDDSESEVDSEKHFTSYSNSSQSKGYDKEEYESDEMENPHNDVYTSKENSESDSNSRDESDISMKEEPECNAEEIVYQNQEIIISEVHDVDEANVTQQNMGISQDVVSQQSKDLHVEQNPETLEDVVLQQSKTVYVDQNTEILEEEQQTTDLPVSQNTETVENVVLQQSKTSPVGQNTQKLEVLSQQNKDLCIDQNTETLENVESQHVGQNTETLDTTDSPVSQNIEMLEDVSQQSKSSPIQECVHGSKSDNKSHGTNDMDTKDTFSENNKTSVQIDKEPKVDLQSVSISEVLCSTIPKLQTTQNEETSVSSDLNFTVESTEGVSVYNKEPKVGLQSVSSSEVLCSTIPKLQTTQNEETSVLSDLNFTVESTEGVSIYEKTDVNASSDLNFSVISSEESVFLSDQKQEENVTPGRITRNTEISPRKRVFEVSLSKHLACSTPRQRSKSVDTQDPDTSENTRSTRLASLRKRSASVNCSTSFESKPEEPENRPKAVPKTRKKRSASSALPVIQEEPRKQEELEPIRENVTPKKLPVKRKQKSKSTSDKLDNVQSYSNTRRLTRKQKSMLEKTLPSKPATSVSEMTSNSEESNDEIRGPQLQEIDPLKLLDKSPFKGEPDPDEQLVHKRSPSVSTDLSAGKPASRCSRRRSISNNSQKSESSEPGNSRKVKGSSKSLSDIKTRLRRYSVEESSSVISEQRRSTRKRSQTAADNETSQQPARLTRSKAKSVKSDSVAVTKRKAK